jgi:hypothetical protein
LNHIMFGLNDIAMHFIALIKNYVTYFVYVFLCSLLV